MTDFYTVLGVDPNASADDIKKAYREQAMKYHPDRNQGDASCDEKFKIAAKAYETLSDPQKRARYNQSLQPDPHPFASDIFGGSHIWRNGEIPTKGEDCRATINIYLQDIFEDTNRVIHYSRKDYCDVCVGKGCKPGKAKTTCQDCKGTGKVGKGYSNANFRVTEYVICGSCEGSGKRASDEDKCEGCNGFGTKVASASISFTIPRGMPPGRSIVFRHEGGVGRYGGPRGDFHVIVQINPTEFRRDSERPHNLIYLLCIPYWKAALGGNHKIRMPDGTMMTVVVPQLCKNGQLERVQGAGLPIFGRSDRGDLKIVFDVEMPKEMTSELKFLLEKIRDLDEKKNDVQENNNVE